MGVCSRAKRIACGAFNLRRRFTVRFLFDVRDADDGQLVAPSAQTDTHSASLRRLRSNRGRGGGVTFDVETCVAASLTYVVDEIVAGVLATEATNTNDRTELYLGLRSDNDG